jgi:hypothetical protein
VHVDCGHFINGQQRIVVEVPLHCTSLVNGNLSLQRSRKPVDDGPLDLRLDRLRIDRNAAVNRAPPSPAARWIARRIRLYVPHLQRIPDIAASMSSSVGFAFCLRSAAAVMIWPDWQYPHWGTSSAIQAFWTGCDLSGDRPSIVVIFFPATSSTVVTQDRMASPSRCTVQAPHRARPHPNFVPVSPSVSRTTHSRGVSGLTSTADARPLTK